MRSPDRGASVRMWALGRSLIARARTVDPLVIDAVLAVLLTAGALVDAASQFHRGPGELAIVPLVLLTGSVALRRLNPWLTTTLAVTAFATFQVASGYTGGGAFEVAAIALNFYVLGRRTRGSERMLGAMLVFAYWLAGVVVITYSQPGGSVGAVLGAWALVGWFAVRGRADAGDAQGADARARGEHGAAGGRRRKLGRVAPRPRSETGWLASCTT